jgi:hypothetical protein
VVEFGEVVPLYQFLFHECIVLHGMMSPAPEPYHLEIANAANGVLGEIPGGVLTGKGTLLDKDTYNWALWEPTVGDPDRGLEMIRSVTAMRRGPGRDYLVLGRMQKPGIVEGISVIEWKHDGKAHAIPAVFHAAWEALDGRFAVVLANWTDKPSRVRLRDARLGSEDGRKVTVAPLSLVMVERP